ncbi:uncharacterized protein BX664DRAFT_182630 [Halteromyces radiatus]|uniref:uncharacterized protein n=1 Tax=Halteromyces radiatus TaxID=101107 RepID=UPI0022208CD9|nr:uncharacterized protein BX664DRAFT_182630 [Halteromyces radiatus]KAI8082764.1 hypothetical protein BX664DRAFT_182630 [Halteromyces radiatus]
MPPKKGKPEQSLYPPGKIVFAKLKGFPWWPAIIQDDNQVPKDVVKAKSKKNIPQNYYTVFFFGSLDYAFFSENLLRPFDKDKVKQDILLGKVKNKALLEGLQQALDPTYLESLRESEQDNDMIINNLKNNKSRQRHMPETINNDDEQPLEQSQSTITKQKKGKATKKGKVIKKRSFENDDVDLKQTKSGLTSNKKRNTKASPTMTNNNSIPTTGSSSKQTRPTHTSRSLEAAARRSPEYERIFKRLYLTRHKLQKLIYEKKPGEIPSSDYPKIYDILNSLEQVNMTKELLKETKIGKVVRYGCDYQFEKNDTYGLQDRCFHVLNTWKTHLLSKMETAIDATASNTNSKESIPTTSTIGQTMTSTTDNSAFTTNSPSDTSEIILPVAETTSNMSNTKIMMTEAPQETVQNMMINNNNKSLDIIEETQSKAISIPQASTAILENNSIATSDNDRNIKSSIGMETQQFGSVDDHLGAIKRDDNTTIGMQQSVNNRTNNQRSPLTTAETGHDESRMNNNKNHFTPKISDLTFCNDKMYDSDATFVSLTIPSKQSHFTLDDQKLTPTTIVSSKKHDKGDNIKTDDKAVMTTTTKCDSVLLLDHSDPSTHSSPTTITDNQIPLPRSLLLDKSN